MTTLFDVPVMTMDGDQTTLKPYKGNVLLIVNVASRCGFTPQYADLEALYCQYKDRGFVVLGFPCNQFFHQEPEDNPTISAFAQECFRITFPLYAKIDVKGKNRAPLYDYLQKNIQKKPIKFIPWNFTKILVDREGQVLKQFLPTTSFEAIAKAIELCYT